ncbi:hypothetical protein ABPG74_001072 [Tetrahymena malaccensis]
MSDAQTSNDSKQRASPAEQKKQEFMKARESDIKIREQIKKKDAVSIQQVKEDLNKEEQELKQFFEGQKDEKEDPTVLRKKKYEEKMGAYREAIEGLDLKNIINNFWSYQPPTPEEIETLDDCRRYTKRNMLSYAVLGVAFTTGVSIYNRHFIGWGLRLFGFGTGVVGGGIYGIIQSTEYTLRRLEALGPDYSLGRMAINEIEDFRMDKKKFNRV